MIETKFKNSEVGLIPEDWVAVPLSSIGEVKMCKRILKEQTTESGDVPFYKIGTFGKEPDAFIPRSLYEQYRSAYPYPKKGTILISAAGTIGRTVVFDGADAYFQDSNIVWIDHKEDKVKNSYLEHYFKVISWKSENGGTISRLYNDNLRSTFLCYPKDKDEQSRIATALSDVDELIETLKKLIEKKRNIKQGVMQELLSGKRRLPGFSDKWVEKKVGIIGNTYNGLSGKTKEDFGVGESQYITFLNVLNNPVIDTSIFEQVNILPNERQNKAIQGDIFFNTSSETPEEVGICSYLDNEIDNLYLNSFCFGFRITDSEVDGHFLAYFWRSRRGREIMTMLAQGSTRFNLSKSLFKESSILIPPTKKEQIAIVNVISDMDSEISMLESRLTKYQSLKQGMMQQLLTGKIRLI